MGDDVISRLDMVERIARALFYLDAPNGDPDEDVFHPIRDLQKPKWKLYERQAIAAIEAMREPTIPMLIAGRKQIFADMTGPHMGPNCEEAWKAMVAAALDRLSPNLEGEKQP